ncbi:MAG: hypothetical protein ING75_14735 [Rhodocyclaceae bacterium]|nr:hypothetical protein [Rhodocyclaceae bacterium]
MNKVKCEEVVLALKRNKNSMTAKNLAKVLGTSSRAIATALRTAVEDGRVSINYKLLRNTALYRFVRLTAKPAQEPK